MIGTDGRSNGGEPGTQPRVTLYTIGHGTDGEEGFLGRCQAAALEAIVDVRSAPGSRRHPQFGRAEMERWLPAAGIGYRWEPRLGGFRRPVAGSRNTGLRHPAFRGYADHMGLPDFGIALHEVIGEAAAKRVAVMCSESLWWRCHRRLIADAAVLLYGATVLHVGGRGGLEPHRLTQSVHLEDNVPVYATQGDLI